MVWVEEGCALDIREYVENSVEILLTRQREIYAQLLELRKLKDVVIPEGFQEIGDQWFWNTEIESVEVPTSVTTIGRQAF